MTLQNIAHQRPDLVDFFPPPTEAELTQFENSTGFRIPASLRTIWLDWGTGYLFETEEFLSPAEDDDTGDSTHSVTLEYRENGLPDDVVVFHRGIGGITCMRESGEVIQVDEHDFATVRVFGSFDEWFNECLIREYAGRYGIIVEPAATKDVSEGER